MKTIQLKKVPVTNSQTNGMVLDYAQEYLRMIEIIPEGITASQMGAAIKIANKLRNLEVNPALIDQQIELEDSEASYLLERAQATKFQVVAAEIVDMIENLKG